MSYETAGNIICFFIFLVIIVGFGYFTVWCFKKAAENAERDKTLKTMYSASLTDTIIHKSGLPLAQNVIVEIAYGEDNIYFKYENNEIKLSRDKVVHIDTQVGGDFVGGAIAGKAITGDSGAALATAALSSVEYLVITYKAGNKLNRIILQNYGRSSVPRKIVKDFKKTHKIQPGIKAEL